MSNPFGLLGNDVEDTDVVVSPPKELVKKNTSSKKADVPPPSANPAKANKNRPRPTGNEAAIKEKNAGRQQNKSKDVPESSKTKKTNPRKSTDRHSRTGKVDTAKKVHQGWGDDKKELDAEAQGEADAQAEAEAEAEATAEASAKKMSLQDYLQEQSSNALNKVPEVKKVEATTDAELYVKEEEVLVEATKVKNVKSRQQKTKEFLNFDATFVDSSAKPKREFGNNNRRGGKFAGRGGKKPTSNTEAGPNPVHKNRSLDTKNLPTLS